MAKKRTRTIIMTLKITAPAGMRAAHIKREVKTRINEVNGYYDEFSFDLPGSAFNCHGEVKMRAASHKPVRS